MNYALLLLAFSISCMAICRTAQAYDFGEGYDLGNFHFSGYSNIELEFPRHGNNELSLDELRKRLVDEEDSLANLRFQLATSQIESPIKVRSVRRDIARINTLIRERERAAQTAPAPATQATQPANTEVKQS